MHSRATKSVLIMVLVVSSVLLVGCSATRHEDMFRGVSVALGAVNEQQAPVTSPSQSTGSFYLGAGDALGQSIFSNYCAVVRANAGWQYASTTSDVIE